MPTTQQPAPYKPPTSLSEVFELDDRQRHDFIIRELSRMQATLEPYSPQSLALLLAQADADLMFRERERTTALLDKCRSRIATMQGPGA